LFFSTLFSLFSTHSPKVQKCPKLLYYFNCGPHIFYCSVFPLNYFYDFFSISSFIILFYFIFVLDLVLFFLIDIYFAFHPSSNWFSFQFHT
jgi:hypothetical protein